MCALYVNGSASGRKTSIAVHPDPNARAPVRGFPEVPLPLDLRQVKFRHNSTQCAEVAPDQNCNDNFFPAATMSAENRE